MAPLSATSEANLDALAASVGARDIFVLRRITGTRFAHLGGVGRGRGWAGIIEAALDDLYLGKGRGVGVPSRASAVQPWRVFGPYWATEVSIVALSDDEVIAFGSSDGGLGRVAADDETLLAAAWTMSNAIDDVSPAKRLADELEMLHAVRALAAVRAETVAGAMAAIAAQAAESLSCEIGVVWNSDGRMALANPGAELPGTRADVAKAMQQLWAGVAELPQCHQDAAAAPLPFPFDAASGVCSTYQVAIGDPPAGLLLLAHTVATPRGFTNLCRDLGLQLSATADTLLATASLREQLQGEVMRARTLARTDALTAVGNRLAFDEGCDAGQQLADTGGQVGLLVLDLNHLKRANDSRGHAFGDHLIAALADLVTAVVREGDVVARTGGDEIAVLLPGATAAEADATAARLRSALRAAPSIAGFPLSAAVGVAHCAAGGDVASTVRAADTRMYADKSAMKLADKSAMKLADRLERRNPT